MNLVFSPLDVLAHVFVFGDAIELLVLSLFPQ
jgi:hypothetical protein